MFDVTNSSEKRLMRHIAMGVVAMPLQHEMANNNRVRCARDFSRLLENYEWQAQLLWRCALRSLRTLDGLDLKQDGNSFRNMRTENADLAC